MARWTLHAILVLGALGLTGASALVFVAHRAQTTRDTLFALVQPVTLENCALERFGEAHDGGYLVCANLLDAQAGYSYGISGYDGFGCEVSRRAQIPVHQYDCFDLRQPACANGTFVFHGECVGARTGPIDGRPWATVEHQIAANGDSGKRLIVKMDVEGSEWDALPVTSDATLATVDQWVMEFHGAADARFVPVLERLAEHFYVAHLQFNNWACSPDLQPFPSWAYEVLYVNKRLGRVRPASTPVGAHPLDAPNNPTLPDCQTATPPTWRETLLKPMRGYGLRRLLLF